jgi:hypothetical protein
VLAAAVAAAAAAGAAVALPPDGDSDVSGDTESTRSVPTPWCAGGGACVGDIVRAAAVPTPVPPGSDGGSAARWLQSRSRLSAVALGAVDSSAWVGDVAAARPCIDAAASSDRC